MGLTLPYLTLPHTLDREEESPYPSFTYKLNIDYFCGHCGAARYEGMNGRVSIMASACRFDEVNQNERRKYNIKAEGVERHRKRVARSLLGSEI